MTVIITDKDKCSCNKTELDSQGNEVTERMTCKNDCNCKESRDKRIMDAIKRKIDNGYIYETKSYKRNTIMAHDT